MQATPQVIAGSTALGTERNGFTLQYQPKVQLIGSISYSRLSLEDRFRVIPA